MLDDLREAANQPRQSAAQLADEITESGYTWERYDQWRTIHNQTVELQKDIRWLEQRLIDLVHWPIKNQREAPPRLLAPYMITGQLDIYPLFSWVFNPNMNQNRLAHAALYLTNVAGHRTVYRFYPTWTDNPKRRGLILASRELPGALQELDEITYPHFRLHHEKYLSARMQEQTDIVKSLLPVPEDVDLPPYRWAELLAAVHYSHSDTDEDPPESLLQRMLPAIGTGASDFVAQAERVLREPGRLPANAAPNRHQPLLTT